MSVTQQDEAVVAFAGGVGGAKLLQGLAATVPTRCLTAIVNTADDFQHYGLHMSPDLDTVMYTLAGLANPETGWGVKGDMRVTLDAIARLGEDPWFLVGDQDFATHIVRTHRLQQGLPLSTVSAGLALSLGIGLRFLPMTDDSVATEVRTADGWLAFQDYFVARHHNDPVLDVRFAGIERATPAPGVTDAIASADLLLFCPSNPVVSIGPILAVPGMQDAIRASGATVAAVSPIVGGKALKGPAAGMLAQKGVEVSAAGVAQLYEGLVEVMVIDELDRHLAPAIEALGMQVIVLQTVMGDADDRARLAGEILAAIRGIRLS